MYYVYYLSTDKTFLVVFIFWNEYNIYYVMNWNKGIQIFYWLMSIPTTCVYFMISTIENIK